MIKDRRAQHKKAPSPFESDALSVYKKKEEPPRKSLAGSSISTDHGSKSLCFTRKSRDVFVMSFCKIST